MKESGSHSLTRNAQKLRRSMTQEERKLWYNFLKHLPITVNRQRVIGRYIVDFYIHSFKLVIELDGDQHGEPDGQKQDAARDAWLREQGMTVLRYANQDVSKGFEGVCRDILDHLPGVQEPEIE